MEEDTDREGLSIFEKGCGYCGARFRVLATHLPAGDLTQEYECPECGKLYRTDAAVQPEVHLLRPRADGRDDRYQETMF